jgi:hypothetical protein
MGLTCGIFYTSSKSFISFIRLYNIGEARQIQVINLDNFPDVCFPLSPCMLSSSLRWLEADVQIYRCVVSIWSPKICWLIQCRRWIITWLKINSPSTSGRSILEGIVSSHLGLRMRIFVRRSFRKSKPDNRTEETFKKIVDIVLHYGFRSAFSIANSFVLHIVFKTLIILPYGSRAIRHSLSFIKRALPWETDPKIVIMHTLVRYRIFVSVCFHFLYYHTNPICLNFSLPHSFCNSTPTSFAGA